MPARKYFTEEEYKKARRAQHKAYKRRNKKKIKAYNKQRRENNPEYFKAYESDPENKKRKRKLEKDRLKDPVYRAAYNARQAKYQKKKRDERREHLAGMSPRQRAAFLKAEKKAKQQKKILKEIKALNAQADQDKQRRLEIFAQRKAEKEARKVFCIACDKAIDKIVAQRKATLRRRALEFIPYTQRVLQSIIDYYEFKEVAGGVQMAVAA